MSNPGNVSLVGDRYAYLVDGSFQQPIPDPGTSPLDGPLVCIQINAKWQPLLAGAALQLCMPATWDVGSDAALADVLDRAADLFNLIGMADACSTEAAMLVVADGFDTPPDPVYEESGIDFLYAA